MLFSIETDAGLKAIITTLIMKPANENHSCQVGDDEHKQGIQTGAGLG